MPTRPRLFRSIPFWVLVVGSLASIGYGVIVVVGKIATMISTLADGSATGVEVYAGQSWIVFGAAFIGAGLVGLVAALLLAALRSFFPAAVAEIEIVEPVADEPELGYSPEPGYTPETIATASPSEQAPSAEALADKAPSDEASTVVTAR